MAFQSFLSDTYCSSWKNSLNTLGGEIIYDILENPNNQKLMEFYNTNGIPPLCSQIMRIEALFDLGLLHGVDLNIDHVKQGIGAMLWPIFGRNGFTKTKIVPFPGCYKYFQNASIFLK
jgi:hypothetical protein